MSEENPFESSMDGNRFDDSPPFANILMNTEDSSPGQQDIAMDPNVGHRSPLSQGGAISPSQGRSVREFDDQMANLRKENFNLKLRIFFLEEKIPGYKNSSNSEGPESAIKENIDLKVSIESLRQELKSKQDLLQEAAHAINSLEAKLQQAQTESHKIIDDLYHKIKLLEMENREMNQYGSENHLDDLICKSDFQGNIDSVQKVHELEGYIQEYRRTNDELHEKITELEGEIEAKNQNICSLEESVKQMKFQNEELQEQLEIRKREISNSEGKCCELKKLAEAKEEVAERALTENENLLLRIRQIENELLLERCNNEEIEKKVFEKERLITELQSMNNNIDRTKLNADLKFNKTLAESENVITDLRFENKKLRKEIASLKDIIVKLEHWKLLHSVPPSLNCCSPPLQEQKHQQAIEIFFGGKRSKFLDNCCTSYDDAATTTTTTSIAPEDNKSNKNNFIGFMNKEKDNPIANLHSSNSPDYINKYLKISQELRTMNCDLTNSNNNNCCRKHTTTSIGDCIDIAPKYRLKEKLFVNNTINLHTSSTTCTTPLELYRNVEDYEKTKEKRHICSAAPTSNTFAITTTTTTTNSVIAASYVVNNSISSGHKNTIENGNITFTACPFCSSPHLHPHQVQSVAAQVKNTILEKIPIPQWTLNVLFTLTVMLFSKNTLETIYNRNQK